MLTENDVVDAVAQYLTDKGYHVVQRLSTTQIGDDLVTERQDGNRLRIAVEAKGETSASSTSARFGRGFDSAQVNVHVAEAVYRALAVLSREGAATRAGIALPATSHHKKRVRLVQSVLDLLGVAVFWVDSARTVKCEAPWL